MARHSKGPTLAVNDSGYFEIRWSEFGRSRRVSTGAKDIQEAQAVLAGWIHERGQAKDKAPSVRLVVETYIREKAPAEREQSSAKRILAGLGDYPIDTLTAEKILAYVTARTSTKHRFRGELRPITSGTVAREISVLKAAINHAFRQRRITAAMVTHIDLPEKSPPRTETLTPEQERQLLAFVEPAEGKKASRICRFVWIALETSSRRAAIETLLWSQVDFEAGLIRFDREEGGKVRKKKRRVAVPISDRLRGMLERFYRERANDCVLTLTSSVYPIWARMIDKLATATGDESFRQKIPHDMRRTWATQAASNGVSLWDIAGVLGDSPVVVAKHYAHHLSDHLRGAVNFRQNVHCVDGGKSVRAGGNGAECPNRGAIASDNDHQTPDNIIAFK